MHTKSLGKLVKFGRKFILMKSEKFVKLSKFFSEKTKGKINEHNLMYVGGGLAVVVVLIIVLIILGAQGCAKGSENVNETTGTLESVSGETGETFMNEVSEDPLQENAYPEINQMISTYFAAVADGDVETVRAIEQPLSDMKELTISARSEYIEEFENIIVYTKDGPTAGSYIVFAYNEIRFYNVETTAAAVYTFYVKMDENQNYYIYNGEINEAEEEYINSIIAQDDVMDLFDRVNVKFQEAVDADEELAKMLSELPSQLNENIGTAVAELNTEETEEVQESEEVAEESAENKEVDFETVRATSTVNVRASASEDADKLGKLEKDKTVKRKESLENGWSCVEFEDGVGYVKSEFLIVSSVTYKDGTVENLSGTCTPTTTINVRASASENADKIGVANAGESLVLLEIMENGWTKVEYDGKEAYVKSEFLTY